jgi:hypothetical protein
MELNLVQDGESGVAGEQKLLENCGLIFCGYIIGDDPKIWFKRDAGIGTELGRSLARSALPSNLQRFMSSAVLKLKPPKNYPTRLALDIIRKIISKKGPIETKQLWALSQRVKPTQAELKQNSLDRERAAEISEFITPGWVAPAKPPPKEKVPAGLSRWEQKQHKKMQVKLAKQKKLDNGHPIKSPSCVEIFDDIDKLLTSCFDLFKMHFFWGGKVYEAIHTTRTRSPSGNREVPYEAEAESGRDRFEASIYDTGGAIAQGAGTV